MNISFKYDKGDKKIIVSDENGILKEMEYTNNIYDLLVQENVIEWVSKKVREYAEKEYQLQTEISFLELKLEKQEERENKEQTEKNELKRNTLKVFLGSFLGMTSYICLVLFFAKEKALCNFLFGFIMDIILPGCVSTIYYYYCWPHLYIVPYFYPSADEIELSLKNKKKELDLIKNQKKAFIKALEKEMLKYRELQEKLSKEKEYQMQNNNQITKVEYLERLEQIRKEINDMLEVPTTEYDNNQTLGLSYKTNIEDDD